MKIDEDISLWCYEETREGTDCDGDHVRDTKYVSHVDPSHEVYGKCDLFAPGGPSKVRLRDGSTDTSGSAFVGHATDEGGRSWDISWKRVTDTGDLNDFLASAEGGLRDISEAELHSLYRARVRANVRHQYPEATGLGVSPASAKGEPWSITEIYGGERWSPTPLWEGQADEVPLSVAAIKQISRDLEILHKDQIIDSGSYVRI